MSMTDVSACERPSHTAWERARSVLRALQPREWTFYIPAVFLLGTGVTSMLRGSTPANADGLWVFSLAHDLLAGIPVSGWVVPGAPMYFPELASVIAWTAAGFDTGTTMLLHGFVTWLLVGFAVCWGVRITGETWTHGAKTAFLVLLLYVIVHGDSDRLAEFQFPFSHGGAMLACLLGTVAIGWGLQVGWRWRSAAFFAACIGMVQASDRAVIAQFVLPALASVALLGLLRLVSGVQLRWALGILVGGTFSGWLMDHAVRLVTGLEALPLATELNWAASVDTYWRAVADLREVSLRHPMVLLSVVVPVGMLAKWALEGIPAAIRRPSRVGGDREAGRANSVHLWFACAGVVTVCATFASVLVTHRWNLRYILPVFVLPLALSAIIAAPLLRRMSARSLRTLEVALVTIVAVLATDASKAALPINLYTPQFACFDRYIAQEGLHAGYAEYWSSRMPMILGRRETTVAEVGGRLHPRRFANNGFWYSRGYHQLGERPPRYDFVITNRLDPVWLERRFGPPRAKESCFGFDIWVYDRATDLEFRNFVRTPIARETGDHDGWWESKTILSARQAGAMSILFDGAEGTTLEFPSVPANAIELSSPTRKDLSLTYLLAGQDVGRQVVGFKDGPKRILPIPDSAVRRGFDAVQVHGRPGVRHEINDAVIMQDAATASPELAATR